MLPTVPRAIAGRIAQLLEGWPVRTPARHSKAQPPADLSLPPAELRDVLDHAVVVAVVAAVGAAQAVPALGVAVVVGVVAVSVALARRFASGGAPPLE